MPVFTGAFGESFLVPTLAGIHSQFYRVTNHWDSYVTLAANDPSPFRRADNRLRCDRVRPQTTVGDAPDSETFVASTVNNMDTQFVAMKVANRQRDLQDGYSISRLGRGPVPTLPVLEHRGVGVIRSPFAWDLARSHGPDTTHKSDHQSGRPCSDRG